MLAFSQYDTAGNAVKGIDPKGYVTEFDFADRYGGPDAEARLNYGSSELGSQISYAFPTKITNAKGHITYTQLDYYLGRPVDAEDANGVVSSAYFADSLDRASKVVSAANEGLSVKAQTLFDYDDANRKITTTRDLYTFNDPNGTKDEVFYDRLGRTVE